MKRPLIFLLLMLVMLSLSVFAPRPSSRDSFEIVSVTPAPGTHLSGSQAEFHVKVRYTLNSADAARLAVFSERFWNTPQGCNAPGGKHQTEGGKDVLLKKGTGEANVIVAWHEDNRPRSRIPPGPSFLGLGMRLWKLPYNPIHPSSRLVSLSGRCYPVSPL